MNQKLNNMLSKNMEYHSPYFSKNIYLKFSKIEVNGPNTHEIY